MTNREGQTWKSYGGTFVVVDSTSMKHLSNHHCAVLEASDEHPMMAAGGTFDAFEGWFTAYPDRRLT